MFYHDQHHAGRRKRNRHTLLQPIVTGKIPEKYHIEVRAATATTVEEAKDLLAIDFDYITEKNGIMLFRKPKMFKG
jgi:stage V sporulation protein SpoVS